MVDNVNELIGRKKVISFDLFDTLITRNLDKSTDVFGIVQTLIDKKGIGLSDFKKKRISSERSLNKNKRVQKEVTLQDIYDYMGVRYNIHQNILESIQNIEIEIEEDICEINRSVWSIYSFSIQAGKTVIITTDMYLPKLVIENILKKNGITYYRLYISCEINASKSNGKLFEYIIEDLKIDPKDLLHIGDNKKSDYYMPRFKGIEAFKITNKINKLIVNKYDYSLAYRFLLHFISNHMEMEKDYFYKLGYQTLGPLLYGYSIWLKEKVQENIYDKIFFLSRDGLVMQNAFRIVAPDIESNYMYASRQALITPTLWMYNSLSEVIKSNYFSNHISISVFLTKMGLEPNQYKDIVEKFGYVLEQYIDIYKEQNTTAFNLLWSEIYDNVRINAKTEFDNMVKYLKKIGLCGKVAIVDIGWFGHMQLAIERVIKAANIDASIEGYYVGVYPESIISERIRMHGYICEKNKNEILRYQKRYFNSIFELGFMASHGSVKRYINASPEFLVYEYEGTNTADKIQSMQDGALKFIRDYIKYGVEKYIELDEMVLMRNYLEFGNNPTRNDVKQFSQLDFYDDEIKTIIPQHSNWYYLCHPCQFVYELKHSVWVTGMLKKTLHMNLDYYKVANMIRKLCYGRKN